MKRYFDRLCRSTFLVGALGATLFQGSTGGGTGVGAVFASESTSLACPFCNASKQTLRQEMEAMDIIAIAKLVADPKNGKEIDGMATFQISKVVKGANLVDADQTVEVIYFGAAKSDKKFLLLGVDPTNIVWSSPLTLSTEAEKYVESLATVPENSVERLRFFQKYLEHPDSLLARDAFDEFASAPYDDVKKLKPHMDREKLMEWVQDINLSPERKRLYYTMLGVCGKPEDASFIEKIIVSDNADSKAGMDAMIACYLTLAGDAGLPLIEERFLKNTKSQYAETYSAIMALRFHATEGQVLDKEKVVKAFHIMLDRPKMADLVIPDLARFKDWSQIDKMVTLFKNADDDETSWVRTPVVNYLRVCPLPSAAEALLELEKIDPKTVERAKKLFPIVSPSGSESSMRSSPAKRTIAESGLPKLEVEGDPRHNRLGDHRPSENHSHMNDLGQTREQGRLFALSNERSRLGLSGAETARLESSVVLGQSFAEPELNRWMLGFVGTFTAILLTLSMWYLMTGSGQKRAFALARKSERI